MFRMVVLPEPFGPMRAWISPWRICMSTPSTALRPPKCLASPLTFRTISLDEGARAVAPPLMGAGGALMPVVPEAAISRDAAESAFHQALTRLAMGKS